MFTVAVVGRPNVGKSTLFNRLAGRRIAITDDSPGATRDRHEAKAVIGDLEFTVIDTAGFEKQSKDPVIQQAVKQTEVAVENADISLFVIDGREGITANDRDFAKFLRKKNKPVILAVNKCEGNAPAAVINESYSLGFGEPLMISAEHNLGMAGLYDILCEYKSENSSEVIPEDQPGIPRFSIVGRPNVGKSTLFNVLTGENRVITSNIAGTTRDTVSVRCSHHGYDFLLEDTAGLRRKSGITEKIEKQSVAHALRSIKFANIAILVIDGTQSVDKQDITIADLIVKEGRGIVIAVNKWDAVQNQSKTLNEINDKFARSLSQAKNLPIVFISAKTANNIDKLIKSCFTVYRMWQTEISTSKLNSWLSAAVGANPPPMSSGRSVKLRYMTQTGTRPPRFIIFASKISELPDSYINYLGNSLRNEFDLAGIPIRIALRKNKNPYNDKK